MKEKEISLQDYRLIEARSIIDEFTVAIDSITIQPSFSQSVESLLNCRGKIITSGIGKAGIIMSKFSSTLCSLTFPSCYLHPTEAQHGSLGVISSNDILFLASTSGKTRECIELINLARKINVQEIIGVTSHLDSPIRDKVDIVIDMGIIQEAGHLKLAPTTSTLVMLAITDALALVASKEKGITNKDFHLRHHSGYLANISKG